MNSVNRLIGFLAGCAVIIVGLMDLSLPSLYNVNCLGNISGKPETLSVLQNGRRWAEWWPHEAAQGGADSVAREIRVRDSIFRYRGTEFRWKGSSGNKVLIGVLYRGQEVDSELGIIPGDGRTDFDWHCNFPVGNDPVMKVARYNEAERIQEKMDTLLAHAVDYMTRVQN